MARPEAGVGNDFQGRRYSSHVNERQLIGRRFSRDRGEFKAFVARFGADRLPSGADFSKKCESRPWFETPKPRRQISDPKKSRRKVPWPKALSERVREVEAALKAAGAPVTAVVLSQQDKVPS